MSDDLIKLEVDGQEVEGRRGQMIIEVTDAVNRYVPRFCYHEKLSIAANCRMCLVEVEKAPKPLPACATPIAEGMKIYTRSSYAIAAQKATMEFLLINHPLDCPICDQGGECELQDLAMGYGRDVSRYNDQKRVVQDKNIGPLVSTDMTRCIHCTRCVRFGQEIAGIQELGTTDRGENMKIGTFIEKAVDHELSGNIIDLCPVGALNNKPYRYSARSWEMKQLPFVSPHDCIGTNLNAHVLRGTVKRVVPRRNESINETWIADRDRYSYEGVYAPNRLTEPSMRDANGDWQTVGWDEALQAVAAQLKDIPANDTGLLVSPSSTVEEAFLLSRLAEALEIDNVDHRVRQRDFLTEIDEPLIPNLGLAIADIDSQEAIVLVGSAIRSEAPILAHRVRTAARKGAFVAALDIEERAYRFDLGAQDHGELVSLTAQLAVAAGIKTDALPDSLKQLLVDTSPSDSAKATVAALESAERAAVILGLVSRRHPGYSAIRLLAGLVAAQTGATIGVLSEGCNSAGASLFGLTPHRSAGGERRADRGLDRAQMASKVLRNYLLFQLDPLHDVADGPALVETLKEAATVIAMTSYDSPALRETATILLPIGTFAETSGTYINIEGTWQSFPGIANPVAEARPGWKVLRVLANLLELDNSDYLSSIDVLEAAKKSAGEHASHERGDFVGKAAQVVIANGTANELTVPIYEVDSIVRHAKSLQLTDAGQAGQLWRDRLA